MPAPKRRLCRAGKGYSSRSSTRKARPSPLPATLRSRLLRPLQHAVLWELVRPQALVRGSPELAGVRHLEVLHLAHQRGLHEARTLHASELGVLHSWIVATQWLQPPHEVLQHAVRESRPHLPDPHELAVVVRAEEQRPERPAA